MGEAGPTDAFTLAARRVPPSVVAGGLSVARSSLTPRHGHRGSGWPGCKTLCRGWFTSRVGSRGKLKRNPEQRGGETGQPQARYRRLALAGVKVVKLG